MTTWDEAMRAYHDEYGWEPDRITVCVTHKRFVPCRRDDGTCVNSTSRTDIDMVRRYQQGEA